MDASMVGGGMDWGGVGSRGKSVEACSVGGGCDTSMVGGTEPREARLEGIGDVSCRSAGTLPEYGDGYGTTGIDLVSGATTPGLGPGMSSGMLCSEALSGCCDGGGMLCMVPCKDPGGMLRIVPDIASTATKGTLDAVPVRGIFGVVCLLSLGDVWRSTCTMLDTGATRLLAGGGGGRGGPGEAIAMEDGTACGEGGGGWSSVA